MKSRIKNQSSKLIPYLFVTITAICILWPQLHSHAFISGFDYYFHMSRTYETAMQIKTGHFSYFLSIFSWHHNARIVNALYGPMGGYFSGLILLLAKSWYHWEICMSLLALTIAGSTMYYLGNYWHLNKYINFLISVAYMLSAPLKDFILNQTFAGFAASLVPLIVLLSSEILVKRDINPIKFALILVLIIEIHLMTLVLSMIILMPCAFVGFIMSKSKLRFIEHAAEGSILMLTLSFNEWGSILEVFGSNLHHIIPTYPGYDIGDQSYGSVMNTYPKMSIFRTPSLIQLWGLIFIIIIVLLWMVTIKRWNYIIDIFMGLGIISMWISSKYFPWKFIGHHAAEISILIQFPKRFLPMGLALLYLSLGIILSKLSHSDWHEINYGLVLSIILLLGFVGINLHTTQDYLQTKANSYHQTKVIDWLTIHRTAKRNPNRLRNSLRDDNPGLFLYMVSKSVPDYMPTSVKYREAKQYNEIDPYTRYNATFLQKMQKVHFHYRIVNHARELITLPSKQDHIQTIPFVKYAHTEVNLNGKQINPPITKIGAMRIPLKIGQNKLSIQYQPGRLFRICSLISLVSWIIIVIVLITRLL